MDREEKAKLEALAEELTPTTESPESETLPEPATPEQIAEAERLLQQAQLAKIRGQGSVAERLLKEAAEAAPGSAAVQAALGDQLWERSQFTKARAAYKRAHALEPKNVTYETKWAESLLGSTADPVSLQMGLEESYASAKTATMLSVLMPGLGQIVSGDKTPGIIMLSLWAGGWFLFVPNVLGRLPNAVGSQGTRITEFSTAGIASIVILVLTWVWSVSSANSRMKGQKLMQGSRKVEPPKPPGEGDFEL